MATEPVKEPAAATARVETVTEPAAVTGNPATERVYAYDTKSKEKLAYPVPRTWLDGRFPNLKEVPSSKKEGN